MPLITLAEYKSFASITGDSQDDILQVYIDAVDVFVKTYCNRDLEETIYTNELYDGPGTVCLIPDNSPIISVESIEENDEEVVSVSVLTDDGYYLKANRPFGIYHSICWGGTRDSIKVSYTAGYSSTPADLKLACFLLVNYFRNMSSNQGIRSESLGSYAYSLASDLGSMGGQLTIPDVTIINILNRYRQIPMGDPI